MSNSDKQKMIVRCEHYILLPHRRAIHEAVDALMDDGGRFHVKPSGEKGERGSITVYDLDSLEVLRGVERKYYP